MFNSQYKEGGLSSLITMHIILSVIIISYPVFAFLFGIGIKTEKEISYIGSKAKRACIDGTINCRKSHRSYYASRSVLGGSRGFGK